MNAIHPGLYNGLVIDEQLPLPQPLRFIIRITAGSFRHRRQFNGIALPPHSSRQQPPRFGADAKVEMTPIPRPPCGVAILRHQSLFRTNAGGYPPLAAIELCALLSGDGPKAIRYDAERSEEFRNYPAAVVLAGAAALAKCLSPWSGAANGGVGVNSCRRAALKPVACGAGLQLAGSSTRIPGVLRIFAVESGRVEKMAINLKPSFRAPKVDGWFDSDCSR